MSAAQPSTKLVVSLALLAVVSGAVLVAVGMGVTAPALVDPTELPAQVVTSTLTAIPFGQASPLPPTVAASPTRPYPGVYSGTPTPNPTALAEPDLPSSQYYIVQDGDTLSGIALAFGCTVDEIVAANGVSPHEIWPGQRLTVPVWASECGPAYKLVPDSELVYGPAFIYFGLEAFIASHGGYLANYSEQVEGRVRDGAEIVQLVAQRYSVGPRVLLALLELRAGWVTNPNPSEETLYYPMGTYEWYTEGLYEQLSWTASQLNSGYYGWKYSGWSTIRLSDGSRMAVAPDLNAGTAAIQNYLGQVSHGEEWLALVGPDGFMAVYQDLFGNPFSYSVEPLLPPDLTQPEFLLPWQAETTWYYTGGPHGGWGQGSGWAALDFVAADEDGCATSAEWTLAAAPGLVVRSDNGEVVVDLDGDGHEQSGWVLTYMHMDDRPEVGTWLERGQRVGRPSCTGGYADAAHLHIARRYNGEWIPAGTGPVPMVLSGWTAREAIREYDGTLTRGDQLREACQCSDDDLNGLISDNAALE